MVETTVPVETFYKVSPEQEQEQEQQQQQEQQQLTNS